MLIESNCDTIYSQHLQRSQMPYSSEEIHLNNTIQNIESKVNALCKARLIQKFGGLSPPK